MLSGDCFRNLCSTEILLSSTGELRFRGRENNALVYIRSNFADVVLNKLLDEFPGYCFKKHFVLHGSDQTISIGVAQALVSAGAMISSVNWLHNPSLVNPIPIGVATRERLQNPSNARYRTYLKNYEEFSRLPFDARKVRLYINFDITTNLPIRRSARANGLLVGGALMPEANVSFAKHGEILRNSQFVLSPPGAGADCFRTWEALYSGAIPIVLREAWPFVHLELPVLIVEDFENLADKLDSFASRETSLPWMEASTFIPY